MSLLHRTRSAADDLPELTPAQLAELDALDAALAGDDADPALAELIRDVRAAAPVMPQHATQHLNERVAARFGTPAARGQRRGLLARYPGQRAGLAATVLIAATIGVAGGSAVLRDGSGMTLQSGADDASTIEKKMDGPTAASVEASPPAETLERSVAPETAASTAGGAAAPPEFQNRQQGGGAAAPERNAATADSSTAERLPQVREAQALTPSSADRTTDRAIERDVDLAVRVKHGELESAAADVSRITRAANGYVATSDLSMGSGGAGTATFELRVDSARLDRAIDQLSDLGTVTSQNERSRDITSALDGATARLEDATKERKALLAALAKAESAGEIASLRTRIAENRRLRARLDADLQRVQRRADLTTISLTLAAPSKGDPADDDGDWSLGDAADDAWAALRAILGGLLVAAAVAAPFALIAAAGWLMHRRRRRAARERALDA